MGGVSVRAASAREALTLAEPLLPLTVQIVADLQGRGPARRVRAHVACRGGHALGAVVFSERCRGRWYAGSIVLEPDAAVPLAQLIDRSPAWELGGPTAHVDPLVPHLTRTARRRPIHETLYCTEIPPIVSPLDPRCRLARADDFERLVDLLVDYELGRFPTRRRLAEFLRRQLRSLPVAVAEVDGTLAAAHLCLHRAPGYDMWGDLTVRPDHRRQGLATALAVAAVGISQEAGQRACGVQARSNPMPTDERIRAKAAADGVLTSTSSWTQQPLQAPRLFPGQRRLRRAAERAEDRLPGRAGVR